MPSSAEPGARVAARWITTCCLTLAFNFVVAPVSPSRSEDPLPDLIFQGDLAYPTIVSGTFAPGHCAVEAGCTVAGSRKLLRFTTQSWNIGDGDLIIGDPAVNPLYRYDACMGRPVFDGFGDFRLINGTGVVAAGHKAAFCLRDGYRHDPNASPTGVYTCSNQGIQAGWADIYGAGLACQWVDITDVSPGRYTLEQEVNPDLLLPESDYSNNVSSVSVVIPGGGGGLVCAEAVPIENGVFPFDNLLAATDGPDEPGGCDKNGYTHIEHDVWFCYTAPETCDVRVSLCGSAYDTKMAVYEGCACPVTPGRRLACNDDSCGLQSEVTFSAVGGNTYLIRVGGYQGMQGTGTMTISNAGCTGSLPDLIVNEAVVNPTVTVETFWAAECAVQDGSVQAGTRTLLRFTTETPNVGSVDLVLGAPANQALYHEFSTCRGVFRFESFAAYRLVDAAGVAAIGGQFGVCLSDTVRYDPDVSPIAVYSCSNQGIQTGWAKRFAADEDGQWIDVTDVPPGPYTLEIEVNPLGVLPESDYGNNVAAIPVEIPGGGGVICADAVPVGAGIYPFSTVNAPTDGPDEPAGCNENGYTHIEHDIWFCYTASETCDVQLSLCNSQYDTKMAVYDGCTCPVTPDRLLACNDDSCGPQSVVTFSAVQGSDYLIRIGGGQAAQGIGTLTIGNVQCTGALPDLIVNAAAATPAVVTETFAPSDCAVQDGCVSAGTRRLLRLTTEIANVGAADLLLGDPTTASLYGYDACSGAYRFEAFAAYRLVDAGGVVATGSQFGTCVSDTIPFDSGASPSPTYDCANQGIQVGWAKRYASGQDCQWIDITDVAPGSYTLEIEANPLHLLPESDYGNNAVAIPVEIACDTVPALVQVSPGLGADEPRDPSLYDRFVWPMSRYVGLGSVEVAFNDVVNLVDENAWCTTATGGATAPAVTGLVAGPGHVHTVEFSAPIPVGQWTTVHLTVVNVCGITAEICFQLAHLPADLDQNGEINLNDATRFGFLFRPDASTKVLDLDGNGEINLNDATKFGQIWIGTSDEGIQPDGTGAWLGRGLPDGDPLVPGIQPPPCACP